MNEGSELMAEETLDIGKVKEETKSFANRVRLIFENAISAAVGFADDQDLYPNLLPMASRLQIYSMLIQLTRCARAGLVEELGGTPIGEAKCRGFEAKLKSFKVGDIDLGLFRGMD